LPPLHSLYLFLFTRHVPFYGIQYGRTLSFGGRQSTQFVNRFVNLVIFSLWNPCLRQALTDWIIHQERLAGVGLSW
jgi:hypothetical protein